MRKVVKPLRSKWTSKFADPHDVYRGNTDHWSIMRVKGDLYVALQRTRERERQENAKEGAHLPVPGCCKQYVWTRERAVLLRGDQPFSDFVVLEGLGGELPGDMSYGQHKNYNKRVIEWPSTPAREKAKEGYKYWITRDLTHGQSVRPRMFKHKTIL